MSESSSQLAPGSVLPLARTDKEQWKLGQERLIASGILTDQGTLAASPAKDAQWRLSIRSVLGAGEYDTQGWREVLTLISGEFLQLTVDDAAQGLEPLRPFPFTAAAPVGLSQPNEEVLLIHLAHRPDAARATVRIVELSKKYDQHLFDGQLGILVQGKAHALAAQGFEADLQLRDTVIGGDSSGVRISGRGILAVVSFDPSNS